MPSRNQLLLSPSAVPSRCWLRGHYVQCMVSLSTQLTALPPPPPQQQQAWVWWMDSAWVRNDHANRSGWREEMMGVGKETKWRMERERKQGSGRRTDSTNWQWINDFDTSFRRRLSTRASVEAAPASDQRYTRARVTNGRTSRMH